MDNLPDMNTLLRLAQSPAGQQLIAMLQKAGGDALDAAVSQASAGDFTGAKKALSSLLEDPKAQALLKQLEDSK